MRNGNMRGTEYLLFFKAIAFFYDIVGMAESPYPVVHVYTVHAL